MALQRYMAITGTEFYSLSQLPSNPAWMACHFSGYSTGLSNMPDSFPADSIIMLDDSTPIQDHDPERILTELKQLYKRIAPAGFLLDFQRPDSPETADLVKLLCQALPCPVSVSHLYAEELDCPVFLPPPPLHKPLREHLEAWSDREIWLEIAPDSQAIAVTNDGCQYFPGTDTPLAEPVFYNEDLFCRYHTQILKDRVVFSLQRGPQEWENLLAQAAEFSIVACVGLY